MALAVVARVVMVLAFTAYDDYLVSDMGGYHERATLFAQGLEINFAVYWPPAFHTLLGGLYWLAAQLGLWDLRVELFIVSSALLWGIAGWCMAQLVKLFTTSKSAYYITFVLIQLWFPLWYLNIFVLSENWSVPLLFIGLYASLLRANSTRWLAVGAACLAVAVAIRPAFIFLLVPLALWAVVKYPKFKLAIFFLVQLTVLLVAGLNTYIQSKSQTWGLGANGGAVFALVWCDVKQLFYFGNGESFSFAPPAVIEYPAYKVMSFSTPFTDQNFYYKLGAECLANSNPTQILAKNIQRLFDSKVFPRFYDIWVTLDILHVYKVWTLVNLGLAALVWLLPRKYLPSPAITVLFLGLFLASVLAVVQGVGEERYLWPVQPLIFLMAIPAYVWCGDNLRKVINRLRLN